MDGLYRISYCQTVVPNGTFDGKDGSVSIAEARHFIQIRRVLFRHPPSTVRNALCDWSIVPRLFGFQAHTLALALG